MLRRQKAGKPITFYHYILDLKHGPCIYKRISGSTAMAVARGNGRLR